MYFETRINYIEREGGVRVPAPRRNLEALAAAASEHGTLRWRCDATRVHLPGDCICDAAANAANRAQSME